MSDEYQRTFYAMKRRFPAKLTPRDKLLLQRMHTCPGWGGHEHPRREILFERYQSIKYRHGHLARVMYWRSHPGEHEAAKRRFFPSVEKLIEDLNKDTP